MIGELNDMAENGILTETLAGYGTQLALRCLAAMEVAA